MPDEFAAIEQAPRYPAHDYSLRRRSLSSVAGYILQIARTSLHEAWLTLHVEARLQLDRSASQWNRAWSGPKQRNRSRPAMSRRPTWPCWPIAASTTCSAMQAPIL